MCYKRVAKVYNNGIRYYVASLCWGKSLITIENGIGQKGYLGHSEYFDFVWKVEKSSQI